MAARNKTHLKKGAFLVAYASTGNICEAAKAARIERRQHYRWLEDPEYAKAFDDAHETAGETLEAEARRRAESGWDEPVFGKLPGKDTGSGQVGVVRKYSDTLLIFLLKGAKPEKYRERIDHNVKPDLTKLSPEELLALERILTRVAARA